MKITSLLENTASREDMLTEHGLSLYIETDHHRILMDMGQTHLFATNAATLGIDLSEVDIAILSHGHYDHGGGLKTFLQINEKAPVYVSRFAFEPHLHGPEKDIGLDTSLADHPRLILTGEEAHPAEGLHLYACNARPRPNYMGSFGLNQLKDGVITEDDFRHEQYLLIEEQGRRVLLSGCSHKGVLDIVSWFEPDYLIGGFHYSKIEPGKELERAAKLLDTHKTVYYTCHCTGITQYEYMKDFMHNLHYLACGESVIIC